MVGWKAPRAEVRIAQTSEELEMLPEGSWLLHSVVEALASPDATTWILWWAISTFRPCVPIVYDARE